MPTLGWVGPECVRKVEALELTLKKHGLDELFSGPIEFTPVPEGSYFVLPEHIAKLKAKALKQGFVFRDSWPKASGPATCQIVLPKDGKPRRRLFQRLAASTIQAAN